MKIRLKSLAWLFAAAVACGTTAIANANEVVANGSFADIASWTSSGDAALNGAVTHSGSSGSIQFTEACRGSDCDVSGDLRQSLLRPLNNPNGYLFSFFVKGDATGLYVDLYEASDPNSPFVSLLDLFAISTPGNSGGEWVEYSGEFSGPAGAIIGIDFFVERIGTSPLGDLFLDDVSIIEKACTPGDPGCGGTTVPEPGSLLLVGAALAAVAIVRRRKVS